MHPSDLPRIHLLEEQYLIDNNTLSDGFFARIENANNTYCIKVVLLDLPELASHKACQ
jgi:hypothetical protein